MSEEMEGLIAVGVIAYFVIGFTWGIGYSNARFTALLLLWPVALVLNVCRGLKEIWEDT